MSLAKVIEVLAEGETVEEAMRNAVKEASESVDSIKEVWTDGIVGVVENNEITKFRVRTKITFQVNKSRQV